MRHQLTYEDRLKGNKKRWEGHQKIYRNCLVCGKQFKVYPRDLKRGKGKYCSQKCANFARGVSISKPKHIKSNGYVYLKTWSHPYRDGQNLVAEHRVVVEKAIGRYLKKKEVVHHIDGNKQNNNLYNLFLCKSETEHRQVHKIDEEFLRMFNVARYQHWNEFKNFDITKNRQDQLQEMFDLSIPTLMVDFYKFVMGEARLKFSTFEQLWLAFCQKKLYNKIWNDEKECWEEIDEKK
ncbi:MAG: HNH endonuclease signature motif containing protein [Promethearchaeota archaeon]